NRRPAGGRRRPWPGEAQRSRPARPPRCPPPVRPASQPAANGPGRRTASRARRRRPRRPRRARSRPRRRRCRCRLQSVPRTLPVLRPRPYRTRVAKRAVAVGRALRNRWRQSFVLSMSVLALIAVALFALVIGRIVSNQIEDQALQRARETA